MLLDNLKEDLKKVRKERGDALLRTLLSGLIAFAETKAKDDKNRAVVDGDVVAAINSFQSGLETVLTYSKDEAKIAETRKELEYLAIYVPKQVPPAEVNAFIDEVLAANPTFKIGDIMKVLKPKYGVTFDGAAASQYVKSKI